MLNCADYENVYPYKAALNNVNVPISLINRAPNSAGNWQVGSIGGDNPNNVPSLTIDNLNIPNVSLIHLDMEGFEFIALQGAEKTIRRCKPLIAFEVLGGEVTYNYTMEQFKQFLFNLGYKYCMPYGNEIMYYIGLPDNVVAEEQ